MQTRSITCETLPAALELLQRGFPKAGSDFWRRGLKRIQQTPSEGAEGPIGVLLENKGAPVGVMLTLSSARRTAGEPRRVVNFSSWYVEPSVRAFAPLILRQLSNDPGTVYTDLTPSPSVRRMLPTLGFRPVSAGTMIVSTLRAALDGSRGQLHVGQDLSANLDAADQRLVEDHLKLGCLACGVEVGGVVLPVIFLPRRRRRVVPSAELVYARSLKAVVDHMPRIATFLAGRGRLFLEMDLRPGEEPHLPHARKRLGERFAKGAYPERGIDYAYSELVYLGV